MNPINTITGARSRPPVAGISRLAGDNRGSVNEIREAMEKSTDYGMMIFDQSLFLLYERGMISYEDVLRSADSVSNLRLRIKLGGEDTESKKELGSTFDQVEF